MLIANSLDETDKRIVDFDLKPSDKNEPSKSQKTTQMIDNINIQGGSNQTNMSVHIEEALHLPKYQRAEEYHQPEVYVSYHIPPADVIYTSIIKSIKPRWNFRIENSKVDICALKEKRIEFKVWRAVGHEVCMERDLVMGVAEVDTSLLFYGKCFIKPTANTALPFTREFVRS